MYFNACKCIEDVKQLYHRLVVKSHPDNNLNRDTTKIMQEINAEYEDAFNKLKNIHRNAEGETYTAKEESTETAKGFADIIEKIIHFHSVKIEIIGSWVWITGNTRPYKDILKDIGFHWCPQKTAWSYHKGSYRKKDNRRYTMDDIRDKFGAEDIQTKPRTSLA